MAIKVLIDELLKKRGKTSYWLANETKIAHAVMWKLRHNQLKSFRFEYIDRICGALDCHPGDLIVRVADGKKAGKQKR